MFERQNRHVMMYSILSDKSGACVDSVYQALFSLRAGDEARYSHNCLARIKNNDLATSNIPTPPQLIGVYTLLAWCCMQVTNIFTYCIYANKRKI